MSNQDYIARSPAKKKKNNPYKKKPAQQQSDNSAKPKIIIVILILLIAAFAYGLWLLKTSPSTKTPNNTPAATAVEKKTATLPKPPQEKWQYVDNLKNKEVEVGQYEVKQNGPYKMQCGSFKTQGQAESVKAKMAFIGIESQVVAAQGKTRTWYQVVLGPYERKRTAEKNKHKLRNNNINDCQIWLWK